MLGSVLRLTDRALIPALFILLVGGGCAEDSRDLGNVDPPEGILERVEFVELMADIQILEGAAKIRVFSNDDVRKRLGEAYYAIFEKHGVSPAEFEKSHTWWWEHPVAMKEVLLEITEKISQIERAQKE
ncbi:MAG: hypothetical protein CL831_04150 [Crocinitomicaceae bacterium]|nr:hypothetical protein [Crocinitomicaceae bacterium]